MAIISGPSGGSDSVIDPKLRVRHRVARPAMFSLAG